MIRDLPQLPQDELREAIRDAIDVDEKVTLEKLIPLATLSPAMENAVWQRSHELVSAIRDRQKGQGGIDALLQEFSLSSEEGVVLMCLAEALLRIPDDATIDRMIRDKLSSGDWSAHLGHSDSMFVNASAWGLLLTGKVTGISDTEGSTLLGKTIARLGEPVIRSAMKYAMQIMGAQFVMGSNIQNALDRAKGFEAKGYTYSYDMLGEGARTMADADRFFESYRHAIEVIGQASANREPQDRASISVKLSALHPRYEFSQFDRVEDELVPRVMQLVMLAKSYNIGLTIDAEESYRLDVSLSVIEEVFSSDELGEWLGFGFVIQAYQRQALEVVNWACELAKSVGRRLNIRLVKGAYWDSEIKWAQEGGHQYYPVFTEKSATDLSYQACAKLLLENRKAVYPQFATHNGYTVATILELAKASGDESGYEFQRLHGMGEELYDQLIEGLACRIYAPVGEHADLLAYLVRRLLENGANTSFVNNIQNRELPIDELLGNPVRRAAGASYSLPLPHEIFEPHRRNSVGLDAANFKEVKALADQCTAFWQEWETGGTGSAVINPANHKEVVGHIEFDDRESMLRKLETVVAGQVEWSSVPVSERSQRLLNIADLLEDRSAEFITLCIKEAGKSLADSIAELREAVDFCRYYAKEAQSLNDSPLGTVMCISPWNFPLAIFLGQVSAALVAGNTVIAKPAEQTSLIAQRMVALMHECIPESALQLVVSEGQPVSEYLISDAQVNGVMFTGSNQTAKLIATVLRERGDIPLIAETGGINAMIVDSTALAEQVVDDVVTSAFLSSGQRCSALRVLYVQEDVADEMIEKTTGAMAELRIGDPASLQTDMGPIIDQEALMRLENYKAAMKEPYARLLAASEVSGTDGNYFAPCAFEMLEGRPTEEVFGPVLHIVRFKAGELEQVVDEINRSGFGLTLGVHSRIEGRAALIARLVKVGNVYVNRNMVGAVVGVQPFGGRGKSGTGPKAGGPAYLSRLTRRTSDRKGELEAPSDTGQVETTELSLHGDFWNQVPVADRNQVVRLFVSKVIEGDSDVDADSVFENLMRFAEWLQSNIGPYDLPSPTGETNQLLLEGKGVIAMLCHDTMAFEEALTSLIACLLTGNSVLIVGRTQPWLENLKRCVESDERVRPLVAFSDKIDPGNVDGVVTGAAVLTEGIELALLKGNEAIINVAHGIETPTDLAELMCEKTITVNTTAAGGNASLMMRSA